MSLITSLRYGLELVPWSLGTTTDIVLADEETLAAASRADPKLELPPLLVMGGDSTDQGVLRARWASFAKAVRVICRPWGPQKLARAIRDCLNEQTQSIVSGKTQIMSEQPRHCKALSSEKKSMGRASNLPDSDTLFNTTMSSDLAIPPLWLTSPHAISVCAGNSPVLMPDCSTLEVTAQAEEEVQKTPRQARILVVEDNSINLNLMMTFLRKRKLAGLDPAEDGQIAVNAVKQSLPKYDIIFMDMSMPKMDGFEATQAIRAIERERNCTEPSVIIAVTGLSSSWDEKEALNAGVDFFLTKPVSFKEVPKFLDEWEEKGSRHHMFIDE